MKFAIRASAQAAKTKFCPDAATFGSVLSHSGNALSDRWHWSTWGMFVAWMYRGL